ncbi:MAG: signal peptidase I [Lachnospiraceae bacterium]|nr:signal peptidase I [Lachnospiraceae bacterium]
MENEELYREDSFKEDVSSEEQETATAETSGTDESDNPKKEEFNIWREILSYVKILIVAFIAAYLITHFLIINCVVPTGSMLDTIQLKDRIIGSRLSYIFSEPERGDIVIFYYPGDEKHKTIYIKRLVGLPGDTIEVRDNKIYLNGSETPLDEPYLSDTYLSGGSFANYGPYTIPEGEYFMMGDHRNGSSDSRNWGTVSREDIMGKALFIYFPFDDISWLDVDYEY